MAEERIDRLERGVRTLAEAVRSLADAHAQISHAEDNGELARLRARDRANLVLGALDDIKPLMPDDQDRA